MYTFLSRSCSIADHRHSTSEQICLNIQFKILKRNRSMTINLLDLLNSFVKSEFFKEKEKDTELKGVAQNSVVG